MACAWAKVPHVATETLSNPASSASNHIWLHWNWEGIWGHAVFICTKCFLGPLQEMVPCQANVHNVTHICLACTRVHIATLGIISLLEGCPGQMSPGPMRLSSYFSWSHYLGKGASGCPHKVPSTIHHLRKIILGGGWTFRSVQEHKSGQTLKIQWNSLSWALASFPQGQIMLHNTCSKGAECWWLLGAASHSGQDNSHSCVNPSPKRRAGFSDTCLINRIQQKRWYFMPKVWL